jgi:predicted nucleotidyltransferase component of viral defense system
MTASKNLAASIKQRLLNLSRERGEDFNLILTRYGVERLLYRLSCSGHRDEFVLKGAMLFHLWSDVPHRPTRDVDLLGEGSPDVGRVGRVFREICITSVEDDGIDFDPDTIRASRIRDDSEYHGVRVRIEGCLGEARVPVQVDVGFGDAVIPAPETVEFPVLLDQSIPKLRAYRRETVVAEKLQAMVDLGIANSRMKDFYDLRYFASRFSFEGSVLLAAIQSTFRRRGETSPVETPIALTAAFANDDSKQEQWVAFIRRSKLGEEGLTLPEVVEFVAEFLQPPLEALRAGESFGVTWPPGGPWQTSRAE